MKKEEYISKITEYVIVNASVKNENASIMALKQFFQLNRIVYQAAVAYQNGITVLTGYDLEGRCVTYALEHFTENELSGILLHMSDNYKLEEAEDDKVHLSINATFNVLVNGKDYKDARYKFEHLVQTLPSNFDFLSYGSVFNEDTDEDVTEFYKDC